MRVGAMVGQLVEGCGRNVHRSRLAALPKIVEGIVCAGRLVPASVGRHLPGAARPKHGIKCVDRLLGNAHMRRDLLYVYCAIAHHLLYECKQPIVLVDWTQVTGDHQALVAAVPIGGRALPIYVEVHPLKKLGNGAVEKRFLCSLKAILPAGCRPVVVTDAGFKGPFFQAVREQQWDFAGRIRGTTTAIAPDGRSWSKDELYCRAAIAAKDLGPFDLFTKQRIPCRLVLVRKRRKPGRRPPPPGNLEEREMRKAAHDPWLLATSLAAGDADYVVSLYAKRMQIEETFRDAKNHRFGWSLRDVRTRSRHRAAVLLMLATLALLAVTLIGLSAEQRGLHRAYQANTRKRRVLSFFVLACAILRRGDPHLDQDAFTAALALIPRRAGA
ncbi:MAG: IS4-like element ISSfl9 family transposase [Candidatus Dormibacteraceae bacterium]